MKEFDKLFNKLINEEWVEEIPAGGYQGMKEPVKIYKNPSQSELMSCVTYDTVRSFLLSGDMYVWKEAVHNKVARHLGIYKNENVIPLDMYVFEGLITGVMVTDYSSNTIWHMNLEVVDAILANQYIQFRSDPEMLENPEFVSFYNEAVVGRWDEISAASEESRP